MRPRARTFGPRCPCRRQATHPCRAPRDERRWARRALVVASVLLSSPAALASGFSSAEFGGEHGNVVTTNPTALYFNPAGIALERGDAALPERGPRLAARDVDARASRLRDAGAAGRAGGRHGQGAVFQPAGRACAGGHHAAWTIRRWVPPSTCRSVATSTGIRTRASQTARPFRWPRTAFSAGHGIDGSVKSLYFTLGRGRSARPALAGRDREPGPLVGVPSQGEEPLDDACRSGERRANRPGRRREPRPASAWAPWSKPSQDRLWFGASYQSQPGFGPIKLDGTLTISNGAGDGRAARRDLHVRAPRHRTGGRSRSPHHRRCTRSSYAPTAI